MNFRARSVQADDFDVVEELIVEMFVELGTSEQPVGWGAAVRRYLTARLGRDVLAYVTVDVTNRPVAVVIGVVDRRLPSPRRPSGEIGYVEWLVTRSDSRRQGAARMALQALLSAFDARGIEAVDVHSSEAAAGLYTELGFGAPHATPLRRYRAS